MLCKYSLASFLLLALASIYLAAPPEARMAKGGAPGRTRKTPRYYRPFQA